jgi:hypothetical protein
MWVLTVRGETNQTAERVRRHEHRHIVCLEILDYRRPERRVRKAAVHQDDRWCVR